MSEFLGLFGKALFGAIGQKARDVRAARRHGADGKADGGAAQPGRPTSLPVLDRHPDRALDRSDLSLELFAIGGGLERFPDRKQRDGKGGDLDTIEQIENAEGKPGLAGLQVYADQAQAEPDEQRRQPPQRAIAQSGRDGYERQDHQREIIGRPERKCETHDPGRNERQGQRGEEPGDERSDGRRRERGTAPAFARHLVAFERCDDRSAFAGRVEQDRGGRATIHATVIDAREHDKRAGRIELIGDRQQKRHGQRRPDAWQNANGGAQGDPDQRIDQILPLERRDQPVGQKLERVHHRLPVVSRRSSIPLGSES